MEQQCNNQVAGTGNIQRRESITELIVRSKFRGHSATRTYREDAHRTRHNIYYYPPLDHKPFSKKQYQCAREEILINYGQKFTPISRTNTTELKVDI